MNKRNKLFFFLQNFMKNLFVCILFLLFVLIIIGIPIVLNNFGILHFADVIELWNHHFYYRKRELVIPISIIINTLTTLWFLMCWYHVMTRLFWILVFRINGYNHRFIWHSLMGDTAADLVWIYIKDPNETWSNFLYFRLCIFILFLLSRFIVVSGLMFFLFLNGLRGY